uniref:Sulfotransferase n=1 Tax=Picocystis salinarum TaxID=88271 RepID=A0A7S3UGC8_9CHLO
MDLNGSKIVFSAMHKHYLEFQGFVYPMGPIVGLVKACMDMGLSGWSSSCAEFAEAGIPAFQPKEEEQLLYMNIYRDPIAAATSWVKYSAEKELGHEELNARVLDICDGVAARIGLRARIAWKILPEKGYSVYSYAYESTVGDQEKWAADLLRAIGLHMSADSVRKALDSVSPTSMKHLLEDAKKGLVEDLPAGLEVSGTNSRKVGMATSKGYRTLLTNATVASCRRASLKHLPLAMALKYQLG